MTSFLDALLGQANQGLYNTGIANAAQQQNMSLANSLASNMAAQQSAAWQQMHSQNVAALPRFVYEYSSCTLQEFAKKLFPDDEQAQFMFILRHEGK